MSSFSEKIPFKRTFNVETQKHKHPFQGRINWSDRVPPSSPGRDQLPPEAVRPPLPEGQHPTAQPRNVESRRRRRSNDHPISQKSPKFPLRQFQR